MDLTLLAEYRYLFLFIAMLPFGEAILVPALYLVVTGHLGLVPLFLVALASALTSDIFWYTIGYHAPFQKISQWSLLKKGKGNIAKISALFKRHQFKVLIYSKFVYGTRSVVQVLSGANKMPFLLFIAANIVGTIAWQILLFSVALAVGGSVAAITGALDTLYVSALVFLIVIICMHIFSVKFFKRHFYDAVEK